MCKEAKAYVDELSQGRDIHEARAAMEQELGSRPYIFSEFKGLSIARAVLEKLRVSGELEFPPLLTINEGDNSPWHLTKGFVYGFGVESVYDLADSVPIKQLDANVAIENVGTMIDFTAREAGFSREHIMAPAVRLHINR